MILEFEDYFGNTIGSCKLRENNIDGDIEIYKCDGNISIADIDFDDIYNTNDRKVRIQMINNNREIIANSIVDDIISSRRGEIYDNEILTIFTNDYFADELEEIKDIVDNKMSKFLEDDNITIKY